MRYRITLLALLLISAAAQAQQWRVAAQLREATEEIGGATNPVYLVYDSTAYTYDYTSNRGSSYMNDSIEYTDMVVYANDSFPALSYRKNDRYIRTYNTDNTVSTVLYESDRYRNGWRAQMLDSFFYSNGNLVQHIKHDYSYNTTFSYMYKYQYNANNELKVKEDYRWNSNTSTYLLEKKSFYDYDNHGNITRDSLVAGTGVMQHVYKYTNVYDLQGQLEQKWCMSRNPYYPALDTYYVNYYNSAGDINTEYKFYLNNAVPGLDTATVRFYSYNAAGAVVKDSLLSRLNNNAPLSTENVTSFTYDAQGRINSVTEESYSQLTGLNYGSQHRTFSYTSFGSLAEEVSGTTSKTPMQTKYTHRIRYNYELYWPVSAANIATKQQEELQAYPVPATDFVNIKWTTDKPTRIQGRLVNLQGQVVKQWSDNADGDYYKSINTSGLPAGAYFIILQTNNTKVKRSIIKQ